MSLTLMIVLDCAVFVLRIYSYLIIINSLLSWFMAPTHSIRIFIGRLVEPVVQPFRRLTANWFSGSMMRLDFSPLIAYFLVQFVVYILQSVQRYIV